MYDSETRTAFIEFRGITTRLKIPAYSPDWNRQDNENIFTLRACEPEALQEKILATASSLPDARLFGFGIH